MRTADFARPEKDGYAPAPRSLRGRRKAQRKSLRSDPAAYPETDQPPRNGICVRIRCAGFSGIALDSGLLPAAQTHERGMRPEAALPWRKPEALALACVLQYNESTGTQRFPLFHRLSIKNRKRAGPGPQKRRSSGGIRGGRISVCKAGNSGFQEEPFTPDRSGTDRRLNADDRYFREAGPAETG